MARFVYFELRSQNDDLVESMITTLENIEKHQMLVMSSDDEPVPLTKIFEFDAEDHDEAKKAVKAYLRYREMGKAMRR